MFVILAAQACAGAQIESTGGGGGSGPGGEGGGGGGGGSIVIDLDATAPIQPDTRPPTMDLPPCPTGYRQDDAGNYFCCPKPLSILSLGQPAHYGANSGSADNTDAFQAFMNGNTNGTATMKMLTKFTHITDIDLSQYDVIILQALEDSEYTGLWSYTTADAAALRDWIHDKGGGLITMSGYGGNSSEVQPLNQLLQGSDNWSGLSYNTDDTYNSCPSNMCYCADSSVAFDGWTTTYTDYNELTHDMKKVGVFHGRSINCAGSDCQVFAKDSTYGNVGVAKHYGSGQIFAWSDEWVTYTSQWGLAPVPVGTDPLGYDDTAVYSQCVGYTPMTSYNVPQFWYNAFRWLVPGNTCFTIVVPPTAPPSQTVIY